MQSRRAARLAAERGEVRAQLAALERTTDSEAMVATLVWKSDPVGMPSPDGRYLSFVDWSTGDIAVRDLELKRTAS